jgi:carboxyl-terminal processing protease
MPGQQAADPEVRHGKTVRRRIGMETRNLFTTLTMIAMVCLAVSLPSLARGEEFGGFGIVVAQLYDAESPNNTGGIVILHVPQDSEAYRAGIRAGDIIMEVDGRQTAGRDFKDIVLNSLRGKVGSVSDLTIKRVHEDKTITVRVKRTLITFPPGTGK